MDHPDSYFSKPIARRVAVQLESLYELVQQTPPPDADVLDLIDGPDGLAKNLSDLQDLLNDMPVEIGKDFSSFPAEYAAHIRHAWSAVRKIRDAASSRTIPSVKDKLVIGFRKSAGQLGTYGHIMDVSEGFRNA